MPKLRVSVWPKGARWQWCVDVWLTEKEAERHVRDDAGEGWWLARCVVPHDLGELNAFSGDARNEDKARAAARSALSMCAGRLAVKEFDEALGASRGYEVEVG